ncbi:MAG TPA: hypothetical protein VHR45_14590 [Thermoanaerobaculia bacterium]|nr:hypothetical protein [Thermoanaerobaculia bacterium]
MGREEPELAAGEVETAKWKVRQRSTRGVDRLRRRAGYPGAVDREAASGEFEAIAWHGENDLSERLGAAGAIAGRQVVAGESQSCRPRRRTGDDEVEARGRSVAKEVNAARQAGAGVETQAGELQGGDEGERRESDREGAQALTRAARRPTAAMEAERQMVSERGEEIHAGRRSRCGACSGSVRGSTIIDGAVITVFDGQER